MGRTQAQPTAAQAGSPAVLTAKTVAPERLQERADWLATGEQALARRDVDAALQAFDRAALILHAADTEIALVRAYMQGGEYRRALAFGAHTAGAHLDVVGGAALYAWLLHAGGQAAIAERLMTEAQGRSSATPVLNDVQRQLRSGAPRASGALLALPARLAPYGGSEGLPEAARVVGSGVLMGSGQEALVPLALVPSTGPRSGTLWLRNGLGQLVTARVTQRLIPLGVARLRLGHALPVAEGLWLAEREAFPGSVGHTVEFAVEFAAGFVTAPDAAPAWPVLRTGFLGGELADTRRNTTGSIKDSTTGIANGKLIGKLPTRVLGIDMPPGPRGGPVFDSAGRLLGLSLAGANGTPDRWITASALPADWREALAPTAPPGVDARFALDKIYEISLKTTLQVIALR